MAPPRLGSFLKRARSLAAAALGALHHVYTVPIYLIHCALFPLVPLYTYVPVYQRCGSSIIVIRSTTLARAVCGHG